MKVGSLIELVKTFEGTIQYQRNRPEMIFPVFKKIYTVRHIFTTRDGRVGLTVMEIDNSHLSHRTPSKLEPAFNATHFRELMPPQEINLEAILELELT